MTMMVVVNSKNVIEINVCVDCTLFVGGADEITDAEGNDISERVWADLSRVWGDAAKRIVLTLEDEPFFSWSDCDGCGSTLGGDRMKAVVLPA